MLTICRMPAIRYHIMNGVQYPWQILYRFVSSTKTYFFCHISIYLPEPTGFIIAHRSFSSPPYRPITSADYRILTRRLYTLINVCAYFELWQANLRIRYFVPWSRYDSRIKSDDGRALSQNSDNQIILKRERFSGNYGDFSWAMGAASLIKLVVCECVHQICTHFPV